ncbi:NAD(P)-binding domain-containing protein [Pectobacterium jejuense]|uniref:NADPH-dependent F420 reductase n=1 Tax=Pectobacterium jejuense TaxID=2974022 RepID=UPI0032EFA826
MNIAVIGSGRMGKAFSQLLKEFDHHITLGCRSPQQAELQEWSKGQNIPCTGMSDAMQLADVILFALPYEAALLQAKASGHLKSKIVIDITNPVTSDLKGMVTGFTTSASEQIQQLMPDCHVVKAFNTIIATLIPQNARQRGEVQTLIASDNEGAKQEVMQLVTELGFDAVNAGDLIVSRYIEPVAQMTIHLACFCGWGFTASPIWKKIAQN